MNKVLSFVAVAFAVCLYFSPAQAAVDKYVLKFGETQPETSAIVQHEILFGKILSEKTNGRITLEMYPSAMMGPSPTVIQQMQMGAMDMYRCDASVLYDFGVDSMQVVSLPYLFKSKQHAQDVLYGEIGQQFLKDIDDAGIQLKAIGWLIEPSRNTFLNKKRVTSMADMKGLKIRVPESEIFLATMEAFGAAPTPISWGEVFTSLQTGVVDGAENTIDTFNVNRFDEVCKYIVMDQHNFNSCPITMSKINWDKFSPEDQKHILDAWQEAVTAYDTFAIKNDVEAQDIARKNGVEIIELADKDAWVEAVKPLYKKYGAKYQDIISQIQK